MKKEIIWECNCQYCGKELKQEGFRFEIGGTEYVRKLEPERCDCELAKKYWKKVDYERKKKSETELAYLKKQKQERLYKTSMMNPRLKEYTFENYEVKNYNRSAYRKAKEYAENYLNGTERNSLYITGGVGTGKTHLAASIANELIKNEKTVVFGTLINLLNEIRDSYSSDTEKEGLIIDRYSKVDMLIIDDLGKERPSEWVLEKLFTIINNRYENRLPVIITTNYNRERLRERLSDNKNYEISDSIISRLYEMCKGISIIGKDKRKELV